MGHCGGGLGAWRIGQGFYDNSSPSNQTDHNILLNLVQWAEGGEAPDTIIGVDIAGEEREHCLWPKRSIWVVDKWVCVPP